MWYDTFGKLRYSPKRLGAHVSPNWWLTVQLEGDDIGRYYRHLYSLSCWHTAKLQRPAWAEHITVVRNEVPAKPDLWETYADKEVWVRIFLRPETNGESYWLPAYSEAALNIRSELGLARQPEYPLHLSYGRAIA